MTEVAQLTTPALFTQYLDIVNRALGENRESFPYRQILAAGDKVLGGKSIAVSVYKDDPRSPHDWFVVRYADGTFDLESHGKSDSDLMWTLREAHLEEVVENPDTYVRSPYKLDLDWLSKTVGVSS